MTEAELQRSIVTLAHYKGYIVAHFERAQVRPGVWVTPVKADAKGFPDLVLCGNNRLIFAELKAKRGKLRPEQEVWLAKLRQVEGLEVYEWKPEDWPDKIASIL